MREILFRAISIHWCRVYGYYAYTSRFSNNNDHYKHVIITKEWENKEIEPETVGQYTWLTDKNWVKIYEGDILEVVTVRVSSSDSTWYQKINKHHWEVKIKMYVYRNEEYLSFRLKRCSRQDVRNIEKPIGFEKRKQHVHIPGELNDRNCCVKWEVIWNIHQHPHLKP
jgi:uncharacterized phage protein (TIGR01671 family)